MGGDCHKMIADPRRGGTPGLPDSLILLGGAIMIWVECKRPDTVERYRRKREIFFNQGSTRGCSKTEIRQFREQDRLMDKGFEVSIIGTYDEVDAFCAGIDFDGGWE